MKLAIVGSRMYPRLDKVREFVNSLPANTIVVSGGCIGVDLTAETVAESRGLKVLSYPVKIDDIGDRILTPGERFCIYRERALARNSFIVHTCDKLVAFWDEKSSGTVDSICKARSMAKLLVVFGPDGVLE